MSDQAHRQRKLVIVISAFVSVDKILKEERNVAQLHIAATAQFGGHVCRNVLRPLFYGIEGHDPDRVFVLALEQIEGSRFPDR